MPDQDFITVTFTITLQGVGIKTAAEEFTRTGWEAMDETARVEAAKAAFADKVEYDWTEEN